MCFSLGGNYYFKMKIKCKGYDACSHACLECDLLSDKKCDLEFKPEIPKKFIRSKRKDHCNFSWNKCPSCGRSIGYRPYIKNFRCKTCGQIILWK